jgi:septum formation topological specificity factor MinE
MSIIISGCIMDSEKYVEDVFKNINKICENFNIIKIICVYDKSSDNTLLELYKQKKIFKNKLKIIINKKRKNSYSIEGITNARNSILDYIEKEKLESDYLIMMDMDEVCTPKINIDVLKYAFKIKNKWDIISFMNEYYYDLWPLCFDNYIYNYMEIKTGPKLKCQSHYLVNIRKDLYKKIKNKEYIKCLSAFNAFCIYKREKIKGIRYRSKNNISFYNRYKKKIENLEKKLTIEFFKGKGKNDERFINLYYGKFNENETMDCEHKYYQIKCKLKHKAKNIILNQNLFDSYVNVKNVKFLFDVENRYNIKYNIKV